MARTGCIYFAASDAGKVLRVSAEGAVDRVGPELPGDLKHPSYPPSEASRRGGPKIATAAQPLSRYTRTSR